MFADFTTSELSGGCILVYAHTEAVRGEAMDGGLKKRKSGTPGGALSNRLAPIRIEQGEEDETRLSVS